MTFTHWGARSRVPIYLVLALLIAVFFAPSSVGLAQEESSSVAATPKAPRERATASAMLRTYLSAFPSEAEDRPDRITPNATECMNFSGPMALLTENQKRDLAIELKAVIDRLVYVDYDKVTQEVGDADRYVLAQLKAGRIVLEKQPDGGWLFSSNTVQAITEMVREVERMDVLDGIEDIKSMQRTSWIREQMPPQLLAEGFLLDWWQWLAILGVITAGALADIITCRVFAAFASRAVRRKGFEIEQDRVKEYSRPVGLLAMALLWATQLAALMLPPVAEAILTVAVKFIAAASFVWLAYEGVEAIGRMLLHRAQEAEDTFNEAIVSFLSRVLKIFVVAFGIVFVAHNIGVNVGSLLAGLGLGGLAFALAAKDTVENLFGSITVLVDRPFRVGDWITIDGSIDGTVETLGLRSTRVRTFYNSVITVPNSMLIRQPVDNYGARQYRRWRTMLAVTYDTPPEKIEAFCEGIRELVRLHPYTRKDYYHIYASEFGAHSLDILVYIFFDAPDWGTELRERHRLFIAILRLAKDLNVEFAFPTQTLHLARGVPDHEDNPADPRTALKTGRGKAREIVHAEFGDKVVKPPLAQIVPPGVDPATYDAAERSGGE
jgi:MscS family membrane protein